MGLMTEFQIGSIIGAVVGWINGRTGDARGAMFSLPLAALLLLFSVLNYVDAAAIFNTLAGLAMGYGLAFFLRRSRL